MTRAIALLLLLLAGTGPGRPALAADAAAGLSLRQDFEDGRLAGAALAPCHRRENALTVRTGAAREGEAAAWMELAAGRPDGAPPVRPAAEAGARPSPSCIDPKDPGAAYEDDGTERAELWEPSRSRLPFGTEVWYGFSMRVDGSVPEDDGRRLVIGQWKQAGGRSPFVAQRFRNRNFHVTFQQEAANGNECRVLLAYQSEPAPQPDSLDLTSGEPCRSDVVVERFAPLPSPFGAWTDLVYRIKGSAGTDGILELWADGALVARATGRIGYPGGGKQYFKFGPYRDGAPYATAAGLDSFARGASFGEVASGRNRGALGLLATREE